MTLQKRLQWVWDTYADKAPGVSFMTAEAVLTSAELLPRVSVYLTDEDGYGLALLRKDAHSVQGLDDDRPLTTTEAERYVRDTLVDKGVWYTNFALDQRTRYDKLVPWVARLISRRYSEGENAMRDTAYHVSESLRNIADWFEATRPDIMRLSLNQALHHSRRWHAALARAERAKNAVPGDIVHRFDDGWTVQKLTTRKHLKGEGAALGHCVGKVKSYGDRLECGEIGFYSIRNTDGAPEWTVEVQLDGSGRPVGLLQVKGEKDQLPHTKESCQRVFEFLEVVGLAQTESSVDEIMGLLGMPYDLQHCAKFVEKNPPATKSLAATKRKPERNPGHLRVYHGSREPDLDDIQGGAPPYKGGIGSGVYVSMDPEVATFYGPYLYELDLLLGEDDIFWLTPETMHPVEGYEGHSVLVGEQVPPFTFELGDDRYTVGWDDMQGEVAGRLALARLRGVVGEGVASLLTENGTKVPDEYDVGEWVDSLDEDDVIAKLRGAKLSQVGDTDALYSRLTDLVVEGVSETLDGLDEEVSAMLGTIIDLEDIGNEVEAAGYKGVSMEGARGRFPDEELLVFDASDVKLLGRAEAV